MLNQMYEEYCANRLPCGVCRLTNSQCPRACGITVNWAEVTCTSQKTTPFTNTTTPTFDYSKITCTSAPATNPDKDSITYSTNTTGVNS